jgi:flagellar basal-body rod protein FlgF
MQEGTFYTALSGALALHRRMDTVANNLANATTTGYKADRLDFGGVLSRTQGEGQGRGLESPVVFPVLEGTETDFGQGPLKQTGRNLDFAIEGNGFFEVRTEDGGTAYTRDGRFTLDAEGVLTDSEGRAVLDRRGRAVTLDSREVSVNASGELFTAGHDSPVGHLAVYRPEDPGQLQKQGDNLYRIPAEAMAEATEARVRNGHLERSNVNTMQEMVRMMDLQRAYQSMTQAMKTINEAYTESGQRLANPGR